MRRFSVILLVDPRGRILLQERDEPWAGSR